MKIWEWQHNSTLSYGKTYKTEHVWKPGFVKSSHIYGSAYYAENLTYYTMLHC